MKVLLDENLPHQMRREIPDHDVFTAAYMGWSGIENGDLLAAAAVAQFEALITNDRGLEYEQNQERLPPSVVVILTKGNTIEAIRPQYPALFAAVSRLEPRSFVKLGRLP